jgi:hypothetical protein
MRSLFWQFSAAKSKLDPQAYFGQTASGLRLLCLEERKFRKVLCRGPLNPTRYSSVFDLSLIGPSNLPRQSPTPTGPTLLRIKESTPQRINDGLIVIARNTTISKTFLFLFSWTLAEELDVL